MSSRKTILIDEFYISDESTFTLHGHRKSSLDEGTTEKFNVWGGIIGENIIGPFFIDGNLNGETYLALLQNNVVQLKETHSFQETHTKNEINHIGKFISCVGRQPDCHQDLSEASRAAGNRPRRGRVVRGGVCIP
ncbi:hypothetical protein NQ318_012215 [Aromia moschata]|uniref:Uncharacterized protein n=1 Tax=Aromia moschata TaxID=1265417 RepID=A0AAV8YM66_9CUCU|nr:hypothetical protein NQ318_012215 [Aromia moschata]